MVNDRLVRTRHGTMIHKEGCRFAEGHQAWSWADDKSVHEIISTAMYFGYETCLACKPLGENKVRKAKKGQRSFEGDLGDFLGLS